MIFGISTKWVPLSPQNKKIPAIKIKSKINLLWFSRFSNKKNKKIEIFDLEL